MHASYCRIAPQQLDFLAKEIEKIFPGEQAATYYLPYKRENGKKIQPSGKLLYSYQYFRKKEKNRVAVKKGPALEQEEDLDTPSEYLRNI